MIFLISRIGLAAIFAPRVKAAYPVTEAGAGRAGRPPSAAARDAGRDRAAVAGSARKS